MSFKPVLMEWHPFSKLFPMLPEAELQALADDIRANGQRCPIILDGQGRILDGRNRAAACTLAQVAPVTESRDYDDKTALAFVVSCNVHRRHLNESQRAMIAAEIANLAPKQKASSANLPNTPVTQSDAAKLLNVSTRSVTDAKKVQQKATEEVQKAVRSGDVSVSRAAKIAELPREEQPEALKSPTPQQSAESRRHIVLSITPPCGRRVPTDASSAGTQSNDHRDGVNSANDAINCLKRVPRNDDLRNRAFEIVADWIRCNGPADISQRVSAPGLGELSDDEKYLIQELRDVARVKLSKTSKADAQLKARKMRGAVNGAHRDVKAAATRFADIYEREIGKCEVIVGRGGRPRADKTTAPATDDPAPQPKKRGRPRKAPTETVKQTEMVFA